MRARFATLLLSAPLLLAASAPLVISGETADAALAHARKEATEAAQRLRLLEGKAASASGEAARLHAERAAAAASIEAAEARISESNAALRLARAQATLVENRLAERRAPIAALLAGLATMGRQPPLLTLADGASIEDMVRVRALLDATVPVIERRNARLTAELAERRRFASLSDSARAALARDRSELARREQRFAELEEKASSRAARLAGQAFGAGDQLLARTEELDAAGGDAAALSAGRATGVALAALGLAPARPVPGNSAAAPVPFAYSLPAEARLVDGLGSVSRTGIASRGLRLASVRGAAVIVPADGTVIFSGPYRNEDGLVIIDHGGGWTSLLLGVASDFPRGSHVRRGEPLGRALGEMGVELRRGGTPISPALIAASSPPLSNSGKSR